MMHETREIGFRLMDVDRDSALHCVRIFAMTILASAVSLALANARDDQSYDLNDDQRRQWSYVFEEAALLRLQYDLRDLLNHRTIIIRNARMISMTNGEIAPRSSVLIENGRIVAVGPDRRIRAPQDARVIDAGDRYLMPGLTDMHVHNLTSASVALLNIAHGVLNVRDMDGFPWMLRMRDQINEGELFAPTLYVAGTILNEFPMGWYAVVVSGPEEARRIVRGQAAAGYDFIKVHNRMSDESLTAIFEEADAAGLDVIGHIPHDISVARAMELGYRTVEHFKSYLIDSTLQISKEDYVAATKGRTVWNAPTFYTHRDSLIGEAARDALQEPAMQYVSPREKHAWANRIGAEKTPLIRLRLDSLEKRIEIMQDLLPIDAQFIAGTDAGGGYRFNVPGVALHDELAIMHRAGLPLLETLRAATVNPAIAMRRDGEFGEIAIGARADLILLDENPLESVEHTRSIDTVILRGAALARSDLDRMLGRMLEIYAGTEQFLDAGVVADRHVARLIADLETLHRERVVLPDYYLDSVRSALEAAGRAGDAARLDALRTL